MTNGLDEGKDFSSLLVQNAFHFVELSLGDGLFLEHLHLVFNLRHFGLFGDVGGFVPLLDDLVRDELDLGLRFFDRRHLNFKYFLNRIEFDIFTLTNVYLSLSKSQTSCPN